MTNNPLGQSTIYPTDYTPELLYTIARSEKRAELLEPYCKFSGCDIWNAYEMSWLNARGLPRVAIGEFRIPADSPNIIESKSFKLYLNSLNQTRFKSKDEVVKLLTSDLSKVVGSDVSVSLYSPDQFSNFQVKDFSGQLIDELSIEVDSFVYQPDYLKNSTQTEKYVEESLISHLLKSNCLITSQPDWASIQINYAGPKINRELLLRYLVSFRSHNEFHEQCVERIFSDIKQFCSPEKLTVYARYTRRGGLDINPWRSDYESVVRNVRLARQ